MQEYDRNALRRIRRMEEEPAPSARRGSRLLTVFIILLFLAAGGFYLKTQSPAWFTENKQVQAVSARLRAWRDALLETPETPEPAAPAQQADENTI